MRSMGERMIVGILSLLIGCDETEPSQACDVELYFADVDGDGFGSPYVYEESCEVPEGFVSNNQTVMMQTQISSQSRFVHRYRW